MPAIDVIFAGTVRRAAIVGIKDPPPARATHVSEWVDLDNGRKALVWERTSFSRDLTWDGSAWVPTEPHYIAQRLLRAGA